jgi:L-ascorbate metabolism protein UlaG (beta-lactamase superfamily)
VSELQVVWLGHATTDIRIGGGRFVTDPLLRDRVAHLRRHAGTAVLDPAPLSAVLISHLHHDHLDLPSIRRLPPGTLLVVPRGAARLVQRAAPGEVVEVVPGDELVIDGVRVTAVPADHQPGRALRRLTGAPQGFLLEGGGRTAYFPGDTDLHPVMADLPAPDVALLPIWGWGPSIGPGHLDPSRAVEAALALRARSVLPVHWGTFAPVRRLPPPWLQEPGSQLRSRMARDAPEVDLRLVAPGPDVVAFPA